MVPAGAEPVGHDLHRGAGIASVHHDPSYTGQVELTGDSWNANGIALPIWVLIR
jgi:hypothetical protein